MDTYNFYENHYDQIIKMWNEASNLPTRSSKRKYPQNHIFDENMSVKWNREEVIKQNASIIEETEALITARNVALNNAEAEIIKYLKNEYPKISESKIIELFKYIFSEDYHDEYRIDFIIDSCEEILEIFSKD